MIPQIGSFWRDLDPRRKGRVVRVDALEALHAIVSTIDEHRSRVRIASFHGDHRRRGGYARGNPADAFASEHTRAARAVIQAEADAAKFPRPVTCGQCRRWAIQSPGIGECRASIPLWARAAADRKAIPADYPAMGCGVAL